MALERRDSMSTFVLKLLWILFLVNRESNLVICGGLEDDSLKKALEAIERRQRDLEFQENEYYGQPEDIGYGFQKTLGFFDNTGPALEPDLGSFDSDANEDGDRNLQKLLLSYKDYGRGVDKRKSNFRERTEGKNYLISERESEEGYPEGGVQYLRMLKNLYEKYRESRPEEGGLEDLTDEEVEEMLGSLGGRFGNEYEEANGYDSVEVIPVRSRKNYRVFDGLRSKRYPSFGEGMYGKRNLQDVGYQNPSEKEFLYSLKYLDPELNREVENLREEGFDELGDEKDKDVMRMLKGLGGVGVGEGEGEGEEEWRWWPGGRERDEKRELSPRVFKNHNGIHLSAKRFPVKRSSVRVRKEAASEEVKGIFGGGETSTLAPKKETTKKPTEMGKKNVTKPEVTKHREGKKVVRRSEKYSKEEVLPVSGNQEIAEILSVDKKSKKSIDWSQYFGLDKRALKEDYLMRAEGHLMGPKGKRYPMERQYEIPFDTRKFDKRRYSQDIGRNIERVEEKIGDMEEKIIDDAVKYTGAHSGGGKEELGQVKSKVIQRLEAAYSLEKMRNALEEFKNLIKPEGDEVVRKSSTEAPKAEVRTAVPKESSNLEKPQAERKPDGGMQKRIATKKEGVKGLFSEEPSDSVEFLNDMYEKREEEEEEGESCPVLDKILHNCLRVEEMTGRYAEVLIPLCSLQQICYFCGAEIGFSKTSSCDAVYLREARSICQGDSGCLVNARNTMLALQDLYEQEHSIASDHHLPSDSCFANPCIQKYFLNAPGAIYPLEIQK